jgi:hypothetical protein
LQQEQLESVLLAQSAAHRAEPGEDADRLSGLLCQDVADPGSAYEGDVREHGSIMGKW